MKGESILIGAHRSRRFTFQLFLTSARLSSLKAALLCAFFAFATMDLASAEQTRFIAIDVYIDPKGVPLAAYQLEIVAPAGVKFVGVEGGMHREFRKAPYYDPKAMQSERLIVAAFSAAGAPVLPSEQTRVLTLHLECVGVETPKLQTTFKLTAKPNGEKFESDITLSERKQP